LAERNKGCGKVWLLEVVEPWSGNARLVDAGIKFDRSKRGKVGLEARDIVERETENREPIHQAIAGEGTEREQLVKTWAEPAIAQRTIEIVRNVPDTAAWNLRS
jgi:hypothetical protein